MLDGFTVLSVEETNAEGFRKTRGPYQKQSQKIWDLNAPLEILDEAATEEEFGIVAPEEFESLPSSNRRNARLTQQKANRLICFIDGEGANDGEPVLSVRSNGLRRTLQKQNYALLACTLENSSCDMDCAGCENYKSLVSQNNHDQLSSRACLDFITSIPKTHIIVGYGLTYDVEHWIRDLPEKKMLRLKENNSVLWKNYSIHYIPGKLFSVSKYDKHRKEFIASQTVYDIVGFFQSPFAESIRKWNVGTEPEYQFIERMKLARPNFQDIGIETLQYNHMEGKHGVKLFRRLRDEYTKLGLRVSRPVGAGAIASAMFRIHRVEDYMPTFQPIPTDVMLQGYIGGRFDVAKLGFIPTAYEYDINSAYPHIARNLPCLAHGRFQWTSQYERGSHSLWLVRWRNTENRWSPFPYRLESGNHIRYFAEGIGYYYGDEVESAIRFDPSIEIIGGYQFIPECEHRPFKWLESYYAARQEMKAQHDFGEIILKLGCNSVYGKLAQSKGKNPKYQNLIWAGMITSGTRAMLMQAVAQKPSSVFKIATDAVFSTEPLDLPTGNDLGQWKSIQLTNLLVMGNGIYHAPESEDSDGVMRNRGFSMKLDWEHIRMNVEEHRPTIVIKHTFQKFAGALQRKQLSERTMWIDEEQLLDLDPPTGKIEHDGWLWPGQNPTPYITSAPYSIEEKSLRKL